MSATSQPSICKRLAGWHADSFCSLITREKCSKNWIEHKIRCISTWEKYKQSEKHPVYSVRRASRSAVSKDFTLTLISVFKHCLLCFKATLTKTYLKFSHALEKTVVTESKALSFCPYSKTISSFHSEIVTVHALIGILEPSIVTNRATFQAIPRHLKGAEMWCIESPWKTI